MENNNKTTFRFHFSSIKNINSKKNSNHFIQYNNSFLKYKNIIRTAPIPKIPDNTHLFLSLVAFTWQIPNAHKKTLTYPNKSFSCSILPLPYLTFFLMYSLYASFTFVLSLLLTGIFSPLLKRMSSSIFFR